MGAAHGALLSPVALWSRGSRPGSTHNIAQWTGTSIVTMASAASHHIELYAILKQRAPPARFDHGSLGMPSTPFRRSSGLTGAPAGRFWLLRAPEPRNDQNQRSGPARVALDPRRSVEHFGPRGWLRSGRGRPSFGAQERTTSALPETTRRRPWPENRSTTSPSAGPASAATTVTAVIHFYRGGSHGVRMRRFDDDDLNDFKDAVPDAHRHAEQRQWGSWMPPRRPGRRAARPRLASSGDGDEPVIPEKRFRHRQDPPRPLFALKP
jgi:hypothetical protein